MNRLFLFTALLIGVFHPTHAQLFFTPGYLVTVRGDTIRGEIRAKDATTIQLRSSTKSEQSYTAEQVDAYHTDGIDIWSVSWLENGQPVRRFMREVLTGRVSLYCLFRPEGRLNSAIRLPNQTFVPLRGNLALSTLIQNLSDCNNSRLRQLLTVASFVNNRNYYERVVQAYNTCVGSAQSVGRPKQALHYEAGLVVGAARNTWYYGANEVRLSAYWNPNGVYSPAYTGVVGGYVTLMPRKRLSLTIETLLTRYAGHRKVRVNNPLNPTDTSSQLYSFREQYLMLPVTGRYVLHSGSARWYIRGGVNLSYGLTIKGQYSGYGVRNAEIPLRAGFGVGYVAGVGAEIPLGRRRHLMIELRTAPHLVLYKSTRMANSRSLQLTVSVPLLER